MLRAHGTNEIMIKTFKQPFLD